MGASKAKIKVQKDGPYLVMGSVPMREMTINADEEGFSKDWINGKEYPVRESCILCRCGKSKNKPYCDGSHVKSHFNGKETATHESFEKEASVIEGPKLNLLDDTDLCAYARFCDRGSGVWSYTRGSDDPEARRAAIEESNNCPSGRLVAVDKKTGNPIENELEQSIGVVEDPQIGISGPLWVRGGIPIEGADGKPYETRNKVTLCRCGKSSNKPFCDGTHAS